ncbi:MAG: hypothetical protein EAX96_07320 [Candidatus Lokiarchaeota archaeon]|nr:hypothetical protein [Candidatus Lokiarchaeota archaeon]
MKPGLLDILACPICKYYPLKLYIFKWETSEGTFKHLINIISSSNYDKLVEFIKNMNQELYVKLENEVISDEIIREPNSKQDYLKELCEKKETIDSITDLSDTESKEILKLIQNNYFEKFKVEIDVNKILMELNSFNWLLFGTEIENGIIFCEKCKRWYPIDETIPQMLPDELRAKKKEKIFLQKWKTHIPDTILKEGVPFNLK